MLGHHHPWLVRGHPRIKDLPELCDGRFVHVSPVRVDLREDPVLLVGLEGETSGTLHNGEGEKGSDPPTFNSVTFQSLILGLGGSFVQHT